MIEASESATRPPGKRALSKASNRAAILDAALAVFGELGYGAASVRDVIRPTGLAAGTFYNYFPDKESVFRALVAEVTEEARRRVQSARRGADDAEGFVADGFRAYFEYIVADPVRFRFMARNTGTIRALYDDVVLAGAVGDLADDITRAVRAGTLGPLDVDYAANAMVATGMEIGLRMMMRDPPDVDGAVAFVSDLFLGGFERITRRGG